MATMSSPSIRIYYPTNFQESLKFNMNEFFYRNIKTFGFWICCKKDGVNNSIISTNIQYNLKIKHPYVVSCSRFISNLIFFLASIGFIYIYFLRKENDIYQESKFKKISANIKKIDTKNILLPNTLN